MESLFIHIQWATLLLTWITFTGCSKQNQHGGSGNGIDAEGNTDDTTSLIGNWLGVVETKGKTESENSVRVTFRKDESFRIQYLDVEDAQAEGSYLHVSENEKVFLTILTSNISKLGLRGDVASFEYSQTGKVLVLSSDRLTYYLKRDTTGAPPDNEVIVEQPGARPVTTWNQKIYGSWRCTDPLGKEWYLTITEGQFSANITAARARMIRIAGDLYALSEELEVLGLRIRLSNDPSTIGQTGTLEATASNRRIMLTLEHGNETAFPCTMR